MATVPTYDRFTQAPGAGRADTFTPPRTPGPGAVMAGQVQDAGRALSSAAGTAVDMVTKIQNEANALRVESALNDLRTESLTLAADKDRGYLNRTGEAAFKGEGGVPLTEEYSGLLAKRASELSASLGNDAQRAAFTRAAAGVDQQFRAGVTSFEIKQYQAYQKSVLQGTIDTSTAAVIANINNPEFDPSNSVAAVSGAARELATKQGLAPAQVEAAGTAAVAQMWVGAVSTALEQGDPELAKALLEDNTAAFATQPLLLAKVRSAVKIEVDKADARAWTLLSKEAEQGDAAAEALSETMVSPVFGGARISSRVGPRTPPVLAGGKTGSANHGGVDWAVPAGTKVAAMGGGEVIEVQATDKGGFGKYVKVRHPDGTVSTYAHLDSVDVKVGDPVSAGAIIARSGSTGNSTGPHLHVEVEDAEGNTLDPLALIGKTMTGRAPGRRKTLAEVRADALAAAGDDPRRQDAFVAEAERDYVQGEQEQRDREAQASDALQPYLRPGGATSWTQIPPDIWNALSPQQQTSTQNFFATMAEQATKGQDVKTDPAVYSRLMGLYSNSPQAFANLEPLDFVGKLSPSDFRTMVDRQAAIKKGKPDTQEQVSMSRAMGVATRQLASIGLTGEKDADEVGEFQSAMWREVQAYISTTGKQPDDTVLLNITRDLLRKVQIGRTTVRGYEIAATPSKPNTPVYTLVPRDAAEKIRASYAKDKKPPPTPQQLSNEYRRGLRLGIFQLEN